MQHPPRRATLVAALLALQALLAPTTPAQDYRDREASPFADQMDSRRYRPPGGAQMGVRVRNLDTGVELTQVFPGSPAERAGLQTGDRIVTVGGYQVGYVDDKLYDLSDEVARRVNQNGIVRAVALQQRTGRLGIYDIPVGSAAQLPGVPPVPVWGVATLSGVISHEPALRVPFGTTLEVRLIQEGINGAPDITITEARQDNFPGFPASYNLSYNKTQITPGVRYYAEARLIQATRIIAMTNQRVYVFNPLIPNRLDLTVTSSAPNPAAQDATAVISNWYRQYLGREADPAGLNAHLLSLQAGRPLRDVQTTLLASNEFYDRCRNNPTVFVSQLYFLVLNRQPTQQDLNFWTERLRKVRNNRAQLVREFLIQAFGNG